MEERLIEITLLFIYAGKSLPGFPEDRLTSRSGTKTVDLAGDKLHVVGAYTIYTQSAGFISTWCIRIVLRGTLKPRRVNAESRSPSSSIAYTRPYKREMTGYYEANCALAQFFPSQVPVSTSIRISLSSSFSVKARRNFTGSYFLDSYTHQILFAIFFKC